MPFPESVDAYPDVEALFERALASEKGIVVTFATPEQATINRGRMNAYRVRLRKANAKIYPEGHHMHAKTPYEGLVLRKPEGSNRIEIEKLGVERYNVEEIK